MNKNLKTGKRLNLAAGIINIFTGAFSIIYSLILVFITFLIGSLFGEAGVGGEIIAGTLGLIMIVPVVVYLGIGITLICFGASNCKGFKHNESQYVENKRKYLGFLITEGIFLAILAAIVAIITIFIGLDIVSIVLTAMVAITFVLRLVAYIVLKKVEPVKESDIQQKFEA